MGLTIDIVYFLDSEENLGISLPSGFISSMMASKLFCSHLLVVPLTTLFAIGAQLFAI